jgi:hypothetical protein
MAIRVKQSIFRTTWQIHHQGLVFRRVICAAPRPPGPGLPRRDSKSPVLSVTSLCADRPRNPVVAVLLDPSPVRCVPRDRPAQRSRPTTVDRIERNTPNSTTGTDQANRKQLRPLLGLLASAAVSNPMTGYAAQQPPKAGGPGVPSSACHSRLPQNGRTHLRVNAVTATYQHIPSASTGQRRDTRSTGAAAKPRNQRLNCYKKQSGLRTFYGRCSPIQHTSLSG